MDEQREKRLVEAAERRFDQIIEEGVLPIPDYVVVRRIMQVDEEGITNVEAVGFVVDINRDPEHAVIFGVLLPEGSINKDKLEEQ